MKELRGDTHITSTLRVGGKAKMRCCQTYGREMGGLTSVMDVQSLFFLLKKI